MAVGGCYHAQDTGRTDGDAAPVPDAPAPDAGPTNLTWTWTFGGATTCPADVDRVRIYTAQWNTDNVDFREPPSAPATFPCAAGTGGVLVADGFDYDSWIEVLTTDGRTFAVTGPTHVDVGASASTDVALPRGWIHAGWTLFGQHSQTALACTDVPSLTGTGAGAIELFAGAAGPTTAADDSPCAAGDTWLAVPPGTYDLTLRAVYSRSYLPASGPDAYTLGGAAFAAQTVAADATLDLGTQQLPLTTY